MKVLSHAWEDGVVVAGNFGIADVSAQLAVEDRVVWIDLCRPDQAALVALAHELHLHELAIEDALSPHQRPKLDHYSTHLFMTCHALRTDGVGTLTTNEIDTFIGPRWIVTVRNDEGFPIDRLLRRWDQAPELVGHGVGFLLYGLLDLVVDEYFDAVSGFDDYYDTVSEGLFADRPLDPREQREWFEARRNLVKFHRLVTPMREVVSALMRREHGTVDDGLFPYYQDVYDHVLRVTEATDALRDLVGTIVETNLSLRDYRQNQIMKKVTSWAAIIAVPTLVTGFYGMNVPYPGFARHWGFVVSTSIMVVMVAALYGVFKRRDWL